MDISIEPMEIDLSANSVKSMEISYCESENSEEPVIISSTPRDPEIFTQLKFIKQEPQEPVSEDASPVARTENGLNGFQNVKKYHIVMQTKKQGSNIILKLSVLLVLAVAFVVYHVNTFNCSQELDVEIVRKTLDEKLYGQQKAIDLITRSLDTKATSKILLLYGGTGVGKTYATSLMVGQAWNSSNVFHYTMPTFLEVFPNDLLLGMSLCESSVLIVDDLTLHDTNVIEHIEKVLEKIEYLKKKITIILVFNTDVIEKGFTKISNAAFFEIDLKDNFSHIKVYKEYIKFETLTEEHLKMCIKAELELSHTVDLNQIMKDFNVTLDGCKGVHSKMKLLNFS